MAGPVRQVVGIDAELSSRERDHRFDRVGGSLITGRERAEVVDGVTPEVDPHRLVTLCREHVDDAAADGDFSPSFDPVGSLVTHGGEPPHQVGDLDLVLA